MEEDFYEKVVQNTEKNAKVIENFETWVEEIIKLNSKKLIDPMILGIKENILNQSSVGGWKLTTVFPKTLVFELKQGLICGHCQGPQDFYDAFFFKKSISSYTVATNAFFRERVKALLPKFTCIFEEDENMEKIFLKISWARISSV